MTTLNRGYPLELKSAVAMSSAYGSSAGIFLGAPSSGNGNYVPCQSVDQILNYATLTMQFSFRYGVIKNLMVHIINQLDEAGHVDEAQAMLAITHVIGSRIEPINTTNGWGVDYQTECLTYQRDLLAYLTRTDQPLLPVN